MKSIKLFSLLFLFLALFVSSCSKDDELDDDEEPDINVPYISMKVDGELWLSEAPDPIDAYFEMGCHKFDNVDRYVSHIAGRNSNDFSDDRDYFIIRFDTPKMVSLGTYTFPLNDNWNAAFSIDFGTWVKENETTSNLVIYADNSNYNRKGPFKVTINKVIPIKGETNRAYISGSFEGELKKPDGTIVKISEGKFEWKVNK